VDFIFINSECVRLKGNFVMNVKFCVKNFELKTFWNEKFKKCLLLSLSKNLP
jgi:hypothetical protein